MSYFFSATLLLALLNSLPLEIAAQNVMLTSSPLIGAAAESLDKKDTVTTSASVAEFLPSKSETVAAGWKNWNVVENFAFGKDRGTLTMIADLDALHPYFRDKIKQLVYNCMLQGIELAVVESFRTHAKQNEYKGMGKGYTNSSGGKSKHQYGLAVDVVPMVNGKAVWDNRSLWLKVGVAGEKLGLRWGGRWKVPYDPAHFEWTGGLTSVHLSSGMQPPIPADEYPCIEEDLMTLRQNWKEWESLQAATVRK